MKMIAKLFTFTLFAPLAFSIQSAQAAGEIWAPTDVVRTVDFSFAPQTIAIQGQGLRSYCCEIREYDPISSISMTADSSFTGDASSSLDTQRGNGVPSLGAQVTVIGKRRQCWHESATSTTATTRAFTVADQAVTADLLCQDTTLQGGFNTVVTSLNFLEITSTANRVSPALSSVKGVVIITRTIENETTEIPFEITTSINSPVKRFDVAIHDAISNASDFGSVRIIHNGAPGRISAKITSYEVTSNNPFTFKLVQSLPLSKLSK